MLNMFTNYETNQTKRAVYKPDLCQASQKGPKIITNIKGKILGLQVEHANPLQLYFHLENLNDLDTRDTWADVLAGTTVFEILTTTNKVMTTVTYSTAEILNQDTADLAIFLSLEDMKKLKKETYTMKVTLKTLNTEYEVFSKKDGYLVVR